MFYLLPSQKVPYYGNVAECVKTETITTFCLFFSALRNLPIFFQLCHKLTKWQKRIHKQIPREIVLKCLRLQSFKVEVKPFYGM